MNRRNWIGVVLGAIGFTAVATAVDYSRDVQPILQSKCYACHGPSQQMNGLRLDQKESALKVVTSGNSGQSKLMERVTSSKQGFRMPLVGAPLTAAEIEVLRGWIDQGAAWGAAAGHWAFQPIRRPDGGSIDSFIRARLRAEGLQPSP